MKNIVLKLEKNLTIPGKKIKRRFFTLIELIICLSILSILGTTLLIKTGPMIEHYRFEMSAKKLLKELNLTRHLSIASYSDMDFHIQKMGNKLICCRRQDDQIKVGKHFNSPIIIKNIQVVTFNNQPIENMTLFFSSTGLIEKTGTFRLYSKEKGEKGESYSIECNTKPQFYLIKNN